MGMLDKLKEGAEQASSRAREGVQEVQVKRELNQAYGDLGRAAYALIGSGAIAHEDLTAAGEHVQKLEEQLAGLSAPAA